MFIHTNGILFEMDLMLDKDAVHLTYLIKIKIEYLFFFTKIYTW